MHLKKQENFKEVKENTKDYNIDNEIETGKQLGWGMDNTQNGLQENINKINKF